MKQTRNKSSTLAIVFIDSYVNINKIFEANFRPDRGAVRDLLY